MNTENNKIIAEFMGAKEIITETTHRIYKEFEMYGIIESIEDREDTKHFYQPEEMLFNSDWNWLMEVVEKIEKTRRSKWSKYTFACVKISSLGCQIIFYGNREEIISDVVRPYKIEAVYDACLKFIKWYNSQQNG